NNPTAWPTQPEAGSAATGEPSQQDRMQLAAARGRQPQPRRPPPEMIAPTPSSALTFLPPGAQQPSLTAPSLTPGSFSPVPDYGGIAYGAKSRPVTYPPYVRQLPFESNKDSKSKNRFFKVPMLPPPVPREPPPAQVPAYLPPLSRTNRPN